MISTRFSRSLYGKFHKKQDENTDNILVGANQLLSPKNGADGKFYLPQQPWLREIDHNRGVSFTIIHRPT